MMGIFSGLMQNELRPVLVTQRDGSNSHGLFHTWYRAPDGYMYAIIEYEDGMTNLVFPSAFKFLDSKGKFEEYWWENE